MSSVCWEIKCDIGIWVGYSCHVSWLNQSLHWSIPFSASAHRQAPENTGAPIPWLHIHMLLVVCISGVFSTSSLQEISTQHSIYPPPYIFFLFLHLRSSICDYFLHRTLSFHFRWTDFSFWLLSHFFFFFAFDFVCFHHDVLRCEFLYIHPLLDFAVSHHPKFPSP